MGSDGETVTMQVVMIAMIIIFILSLAVILFFVIYQKKLLIQQKRYQEDLLRAVISGQEQERNRVARELHDDLGAMLTTTKLYVGQISSQLSTLELDQLTSKVNTFFEEMITNTRRISQDLRPAILEKMGIREGVQSLADQLNEIGPLRVHFHSNFNRLSRPESELNLYRIIQELINNTIKHAEATEANISIFERGHHIHLTYRDNGNGIDLKQLNHQRGIGLKNIESRVNICEGSIHFPTQDNGMQVEIEIPHPKQPS